MLLVKLGGSIVTNKKRPSTPRRKALDKIVKNLKKIDEPMIIVHGGGSYGHYWSVKYNMHTKPAKYSPRGLSVVKNSMVDLNKIILDSFLNNKLNPYCLPPTDFVIGNKPIVKNIKEIEKIAKGKLIPITFGDALWFGNNKSFILSGDKIMTMLAKIIRPRLSIFVLNVDGLYSNFNRRDLIYEFGSKKSSIAKTEMDVTGGMDRKVQEATKISKMGLNVFFVNGNKPERIVNAVKRKKFEGTMFRGL